MRVKFPPYKNNFFNYNLQYFVAVLLFAALAQATPIEYGHYAAPALVHAPVYHAPIAKHVVEPIVILKSKKQIFPDR